MTVRSSKSLSEIFRKVFGAASLSWSETFQAEGPLRICSRKQYLSGRTTHGHSCSAGSSGPAEPRNRSYPIKECNLLALYQSTPVSV